MHQREIIPWYCYFFQLSKPFACERSVIKDDQENIYLVGMAGNIKGQDVADLFLLRIDNMQSFQLKKIASKNFGTQEKTKFRWGAGITQTNDGKIRITSCGENLWDESFLTTYKNEK